MRNLDCLIFCLVLGAVSCYYPGRWPRWFPSSDLRMTSPFHRSSHQSRFPRSHSFGRVLSPRSSFNPFGRTRSFSEYNDFNNNNNWNNNDDIFSSFSGGARRGIRLSGSRIIPQRIRIPLGHQRGHVSSFPLGHQRGHVNGIPLRSRFTTRRRLPIMHSSPSFRVPRRQISRGRLTERHFTGVRRLTGRPSTGTRRPTGRQSTGTRRPTDQVMAILAFDNHHHESTGHQTIDSNVGVEADLNLNIDNGLTVDAPISAEFEAQSSSIKRVPIKSDSISVIETNPIVDVVKENSLDKKITKVSAKSNIKISDADTVNIVKGAAVKSGSDGTASVEAAHFGKKVKKIKTSVAHATEKEIKLSLPVVDTKVKNAIKKSITKGEKEIHDAAIITDAIVPAAVLTSKVSAKSDIKISDADTVNILTSAAVQSGNNEAATVKAAVVDNKAIGVAVKKIKGPKIVVDTKDKLPIKKSISEGERTIHSATIVKDAIVPVNVVQAKVSAKSDIKISDADTVNILKTAVVRSGNDGTATADKTPIRIANNKLKKDAKIIVA